MGKLKISGPDDSESDGGEGGDESRAGYVGGCDRVWV